MTETSVDTGVWGLGAGDTGPLTLHLLFWGREPWVSVPSLLAFSWVTAPRFL